MTDRTFQIIDREVDIIIRRCNSYEQKADCLDISFAEAAGKENLKEMENTLDQLLEVFEHDKRTKLYEKTLFVYNTINKALETL